MGRKKKTLEEKLADVVSDMVEEAVEEAVDEMKQELEDSKPEVVEEPKIVESRIVLPEAPSIIVKTTTSKEWVLTAQGWDLV